MFGILVKLLQKTMNNITEVTLLLPEEDARRFIIFQQYYEPFSILIDKGVFNVRNGSVALHFDAVGTLQSIQRADILYSKRFEK